jgi:site-specific recombinase XerD
MTRFDNCPMSIKFFLYETYKKSEREYPLYVRLLIHRTKADMSMSKLIDPGEWNMEAGRFKDTTKNNRYQNNRLSEIEGKLLISYETLAKEYDLVTAKMVKDLFQGKMAPYKIKLLDFFDSYIREIEAKSGEYRYGTVQNYMATVNHLKNFLAKKNMVNILMKDFTKKWLMDFETYMLSLKMKAFNRPMKKNSANKYLSKLKTVFNNARRRGIILKSPFEDFKMKYLKTNRIYLTKEEIELLKTHPLGDNVCLQTVRDIFLFSVYTGLRYSDALSLPTNRLIKDANGTLWITGIQVKTSEPIDIPVLKQALVIIERYKELQQSTGFVLPRMSNQKINTYLKEITRLAGIDKHLTHHCGRHSFATTVCLEAGVDIKTVSRMLCHTSLKSTEVYAKVTRKHLANVVNQLDGK